MNFIYLIVAQRERSKPPKWIEDVFVNDFDPVSVKEEKHKPRILAEDIRDDLQLVFGEIEVVELLQLGKW